MADRLPALLQGARAALASLATFVLAHPATVALAVLLAPLTLFLLWLLQPLRTAYAQRRSPVYDIENSFETENGTRSPFPRIRDAASVLVSVVVPAYNEAKRIDVMMGEMLGYLEGRARADRAFTWEVLIVDDGSKDETAALVQRRYVNVHGSRLVRLLRLHKNCGKGGAVRKGMLRARGQFVIFADADGATQASDLGALLDACRTTLAARALTPTNGAHGGGAANGARLAGEASSGLVMAVGSRAHIDEEAEAKASRTAFRALLHDVFDLLKRVLLGGLGGVRDTQCGFKMFSRAAVARIFPVMHIERWAFDVELIYLAARFGVPIVEVPVTWHEVGGSTLEPFEASLQMFRDICVIRLCYLVGIWLETDGTSADAAADATAPVADASVSAPAPAPAPVAEATRRRAAAARGAAPS